MELAIVLKRNRTSIAGILKHLARLNNDPPAKRSKFIKDWNVKAGKLMAGSPKNYPFG